MDALAGIYAVQTDDGWEVQEAVDPAADDPLTERERPRSDWYAATVLPVVALVTSPVRALSHDVPCEVLLAFMGRIEGATRGRVVGRRRSKRSERSDPLNGHDGSRPR